MKNTDEQVKDFVEACILIAETDLEALLTQKNLQLEEKLRYFAPSALEALAQLEVMMRATTGENIPAGDC